MSWHAQRESSRRRKQSWNSPRARQRSQSYDANSDLLRLGAMVRCRRQQGETTSQDTVTLAAPIRITHLSTQEQVFQTPSTFAISSHSAKCRRPGDCSRPRRVLAFPFGLAQESEPVHVQTCKRRYCPETVCSWHTSCRPRPSASTTMTDTVLPLRANPKAVQTTNRMGWYFSAISSYCFYWNILHPLLLDASPSSRPDVF